MKLEDLLPRLLDRSRAPRSWWWPGYLRDGTVPATARDGGERQGERRSSDFDEACRTIQRTMLAIVVYACFCLFTLGTPDSELVENRIVVPFASVQVNFLDFAIVGPAILVGLTIYLQIFVGYWQSIRGGLDRSDSPFLFNMSGGVPRLLTGFLFYYLTPVVLAAFSYKVDPYTGSSWLPILTLVAFASMLFLQIRRRDAAHRRSIAYRAMWAAFGLVSVFTALVAVNQIDTVDARSTEETASDIIGSATMAAMEMVGFQFVEITQVGQVTSVQGDVRLQRVDAEKVAVTPTTPVFERDSIATGRDGKVTVTFLDQTSINVGPSSTLQLDEFVRGGLAGASAGSGETVRFVGGTLSTRAPFRKLELTGVDLTHISLGRNNMRNAILAKSDLSGVNLSRRDLRDAVFDGAILKATDLKESNLSHARAVYAVLTNASLSNAVLEGADLEGANLTGADLRAANLRSASLVGADLRDTDLEGADLRDADLSRAANLLQSQLDGACGNRQTTLPAELTVKACGGYVPFKIRSPAATIGIRG